MSDYIADVAGMADEEMAGWAWWSFDPGGWSPLTDHALRALAARPDVCLVAATDANPQGETYAERLRALAEEAGCGWQRLRPPAHEDWNDLLRQTEREREKRKKEREGVPHSRRPRQGKLRPAEAGP